MIQKIVNQSTNFYQKLLALIPLIVANHA